MSLLCPCPVNRLGHAEQFPVERTMKTCLSSLVFIALSTGYWTELTRSFTDAWGVEGVSLGILEGGLMVYLKARHGALPKCRGVGGWGGSGVVLGATLQGAENFFTRSFTDAWGVEGVSLGSIESGLTIFSGGASLGTPGQKIPSRGKQGQRRSRKRRERSTRKQKKKDRSCGREKEVIPQPLTPPPAANQVSAQTVEKPRRTRRAESTNPTAVFLGECNFLHSTAKFHKTGKKL